MTRSLHSATFGLLLVLFPWSPSRAVPASPIRLEPESPTPRPRIRETAIDRFEVLAINPTHAAIRVTYRTTVTPPPDAPDAEVQLTESGWPAMSSIDCHYAGMQDMPTSGVKLLRVDLVTGEHAEHAVYPAAGNETECRSHEESEKTLNAAKADFAAHGLDLSSPPNAIPIEGDTVECGDSSYTLEYRTARECPYELEEGAIISPDCRLRRQYMGSMADDPMSGLVVSTIHGPGDSDYTTYATYALAFGGQEELEFVFAFETADGCVFLERERGSNGRSRAWTHYGLSTVLPTPADDTPKASPERDATDAPPR